MIVSSEIASFAYFVRILRVVGSILPGPSQKGPESVRIGHIYIFLSR
jgi:hypothetical protein